ncbi:hypothetical protein EJ02DRAFT_451630 [Clathrospora elynae]|uniref:Uncharacterized protein n=1 Tax=Clathrospora elynae TaxID=706981 RepID=A0A6A5SZJ6_9PLEO|nr:hypothetical protein EJ02DRAFT_451630 [Clathrospora elynae]
MAPRGRSSMAGADGDRSYDSSPDPLALPMDDNNAMPRRKLAAKEGPTARSPSKQDRRLEASELIFSSPSKSMVMSTPRAGGASPWRIKVTVQAEPGSDEENTMSPSVKRLTRTKTTTVPLKDADIHTPAKRPRGRPRKSDAGSALKPKRNGTPAKRAARSKSRDTILRVGESSAADVDTDVPPKKRRGRPRKSVQPLTEDDNTIVVEVPQNLDTIAVEATPSLAAQPNTTSSKKSARFADVFIPAVDKTDATPQLSPIEHHGTPRRIYQGKSVGGRKATPHSKKVALVDLPSDEESDQDSHVLTPTSGEENEETHQVSHALAVSQHLQASLRTPSETPAQSSEAGDDAQAGALDDDDDDHHSVQAFEDDKEDDAHDLTNFAFDEGATRMPDDTTVLDSENFSMISVDSLPSNGRMGSPPKPDDLQTAAVPTIGALLQHEYLRPSPSHSTKSTAPPIDKPLPSSLDITGGLSIVPSRAVASPRYKTPAIDAEVPSVMPVIEPAQPAIPKSQTPGLGRAVTAGVALQGLLDPSRLTPGPSQKALDEKRDRLNDLFRGFSEGSRRELQANLRLGEQLAEDQASEQPAPAVSSPIKSQPAAAPKESVFRTQRKYRESRLLTPEDQDHVVTPAEPATEPTVTFNDVQYPILNVEEVDTAPPSPARSENEMSWRTDTPPAKLDTATSGYSHTIGSEQKESIVTANKPIQQVDYADIWQEEASRSSNSAESDNIPAEKSPQLQDLFTDDGPIMPARGKLPRTWRRKNESNFYYSDEAESPQQPSLARTESAGSAAEEPDMNEVVVVEDQAHEDQQMEDDEDSENGSDASDDTGMFFQSNMPNVFDKNRPSRFEQRQQKTEKLSLSSLLDQGESLLPDSSPPVVTKKSSPTTKTNPFLDTPPRFPALMSSPKKSSPLRREIRGSDISSSTLQRFEDESTLPLAQSSPFHTIVDGESMISAASDQRQIRMEMEGSTVSTIRRVRNEADGYLDAYEPQERSLNEITEVTEPSRTWQQGRSVLASNPSKMQQNFVQSMLSSSRKPVPLFNALERPHGVEDEESDGSSNHQDTEASSEAGLQPNTAPQPQESLFSRVKSTIFRPSPPAPHPIISRLYPLPKVEPWTKTHYKALDKLYAMHLKHPALFCASVSPPTPLSNTNGYLLRQFISATDNMPFVDAIFHAWGYEMLMSEELVVLCSVFMELMSLESIQEYEEKSGRNIQMGNCVPGRAGDAITGEEVLRRLATVVLGEAVRRDEKAGMEIDRSRGLEIEWPRQRR